MDCGGVMVEEKGRRGGGEGPPKKVVTVCSAVLGGCTVMLSLMLRCSSVSAPGGARSWCWCRPSAVIERVMWRSDSAFCARFWHCRSVRASLRGPQLGRG